MKSLNDVVRSCHQPLRRFRHILVLPYLQALCPIDQGKLAIFVELAPSSINPNWSSYFLQSLLPSLEGRKGHKVSRSSPMIGRVSRAQRRIRYAKRTAQSRPHARDAIRRSMIR
ncbi:hypothetical protein [Paraburkholderia kirstenboschensis]|uniref:hypothetical protein n=1 Tax=Paraburkholderia kirstenboschensis TaxID=1245436 RepID=UPI0013E28ECF|nr:hypothetical protein [Paraburkholderia kirstenboschensis]